MSAVLLHQLAHARSGDKGNRLNIALICYRPEFFDTVAAQVTPDRVAQLFAGRDVGAVQRYDLPKLWAFNFALDHALDGGVNASLGLDGHGKTLSFRLLTLTVALPPAILSLVQQPA
ncbi:hypothetical protein [Ferrovibrio terrae]|uniref:AtuA-related protein n=1 Tax=Ferrovibrio terrae TaxID=2594003 RepID=UPI0031381CD2